MVMLVLHARFEVFRVKFATNVTWGQFLGIFDINKSQYVEKLSKLRTIFACLLDFLMGGHEKKLESFVCPMVCSHILSQPNFFAVTIHGHCTPPCLV